MAEPREYIFFCDESDRKGRYYSNFYGGVRVSSNDIDHVNGRLNGVKAQLGIAHEVKWCSTDTVKVEAYEKLISAFFEEIAAKRLVMRVMFRQNAHVPIGLTKEQREDEYFILYYQFLKHAFGFSCMPDHCNPPRIRIYLDEIVETKARWAKFKGFVGNLQEMRTTNSAGFTLDEADVNDVHSHDHILMQCLDVVLGAICFRLNNKHLEIPVGQRKRGKRTIAKERLYKHIHRQIVRTTNQPHFNIGISTGSWGIQHGTWLLPYMHWRFVPKERRFDRALTKP